jgi:hypothetical protein
MVRDIARADRLRFRLASIRADMPRQLVGFGCGGTY